MQISAWINLVGFVLMLPLGIWQGLALRLRADHAGALDADRRLRDRARACCRRGCGCRGCGTCRPAGPACSRPRCRSRRRSSASRSSASGRRSRTASRSPARSAASGSSRARRAESFGQVAWAATSLHGTGPSVVSICVVTWPMRKRVSIVSATSHRNAVARMAGRHHEMRRHRVLRRAHRPDVQVVHGARRRAAPRGSRARRRCRCARAPRRARAASSRASATTCRRGSRARRRGPSPDRSTRRPVIADDDRRDDDRAGDGGVGDHVPVRAAHVQVFLAARQEQQRGRGVDDDADRGDPDDDDLVDRRRREQPLRRPRTRCRRRRSAAASRSRARRGSSCRRART